MRKATSRRLAASAVVIALCVVSVRLVRGSYKAYTPAAPAYRQTGPADASVILSEFSDFQCPGCAAAVETIKKLEEMHPGKIRVVYKHHPWEFHRYAMSDAIFAECAGKQGKFWPVYDILFARQAEWASEKRGAKGDTPCAE